RGAVVSGFRIRCRNASFLRHRRIALYGEMLERRFKDRTAPGTPTRNTSYLLNFSLFRDESRVNLLDEPIRQFLNLLGIAAMIILAHLPIFLELLQKVHAVAPDVANGDPRLLRILMREFHEFLPPIRREARNRETQYLPVHDGIKAEVGFPNCLINRLDV